MMRTELDRVAAEVAEGHDHLTNSVATLAVKMGELQGTSSASRPPPAPGLDVLEALSDQVIGLDGEIRNEKGRTAQLFQEVDSRLAELQAEARRSAEAAGAVTGSAQAADPMAHGNDSWSQSLGKGGQGPARAPTAPETFRMHTPPPTHGQPTDPWCTFGRLPT